MGAPAVSPRPRPRPTAKPKPKARPRPVTRSRSAAPARKPRAAAPARKPRTAPRTNYRSRSRVGTRGGVAMLPVNAVGGIADSGFVVGLTRGRAWIVALGLLLGGIVAINVLGLSLSSSGSDTATRVDELQQANSVLRARIANRLSNDRIAGAAGALGLSVPAPDAVRYLGSKTSDAETAADRLAQGLIANAPAATEPTDAALADPAVTATTDPATVTDPAAGIDPATGLPVDSTATAATTAGVDPALATPATTTP